MLEDIEHIKRFLYFIVKLRTSTSKTFTYEYFCLYGIKFYSKFLILGLVYTGTPNSCFWSKESSPIYLSKKLFSPKE